jgi:hypothetical protein
VRKIFTDLTIKSLLPGTYFDAKTPAFGIRIGKHRKTWIVVRGKARIQTVIGHYPAMPLSEARTEAKKLLTEKLVKRSRLTFGDAKDIFLEENYRDARPSTKKEQSRLLNKHFTGLTGILLADLGDADIAHELKLLCHVHPSRKEYTAPIMLLGQEEDRTGKRRATV